MVYTINIIVEQVGKIAIQGNIIPNEWYAHLRNEKSKIQTNAALILADIVYWYRPIPTYDIKTSEIVGYGKKFKDDLLQLNYKYFNKKFGFSEIQSRNALIFLENKGLIFREFCATKIGPYLLNNVMYIGIYPEKISSITQQIDQFLSSSISEMQINPSTPQTPSIQTESPQFKTKEKDWSVKFSDEQKSFLNYLLNIQPEMGDPIEKNHATWWIKSFGIEKIKTALQVYWERVERAKLDPTVPMPQHIGKYMRTALNENLRPMGSNSCTPYLEKSKQVFSKVELGGHENETTYTNISMTSMSLNEINDSNKSLTYQKNEALKTKSSTKQNFVKSPISLNKSLPSIAKNLNKENFKNLDWKKTFNSEQIIKNKRSVN